MAVLWLLFTIGQNITGLKQEFQSAFQKAGGLTRESVRSAFRSLPSATVVVCRQLFWEDHGAGVEGQGHIVLWTADKGISVARGARAPVLNSFPG